MENTAKASAGMYKGLSQQWEKEYRDNVSTYGLGAEKIEELLTQRAEEAEKGYDRSCRNNETVLLNTLKRIGWEKAENDRREYCENSTLTKTAKLFLASYVMY